MPRSSGLSIIVGERMSDVYERGAPVASVILTLFQSSSPTLSMRAHA